MGQTREERIARELQKQWPNADRLHYVVLVGKSEGMVNVSGPSGPVARDLLGQLLADSLGITNGATRTAAAAANLLEAARYLVENARHPDEACWTVDSHAVEALGAAASLYERALAER